MSATQLLVTSLKEKATMTLMWGVGGKGGKAWAGNDGCLQKTTNIDSASLLTTGFYWRKILFFLPHETLEQATFLYQAVWDYSDF